MFANDSVSTFSKRSRRNGSFASAPWPVDPFPGEDRVVLDVGILPMRHVDETAQIWIEKREPDEKPTVSPQLVDHCMQ